MRHLTRTRDRGVAVWAGVPRGVRRGVVHMAGYTWRGTHGGGAVGMRRCRGGVSGRGVKLSVFPHAVLNCRCFRTRLLVTACRTGLTALRVYRTQPYGITGIPHPALRYLRLTVLGLTALLVYRTQPYGSIGIPHPALRLIRLTALALRLIRLTALALRLYW